MYHKRIQVQGMKVLGLLNMASIILMTDKQNGRRLKASHNALAYDALLTHPNIIQVHDVGGR